MTTRLLHDFKINMSCARLELYINQLLIEGTISYMAWRIHQIKDIRQVQDKLCQVVKVILQLISQKMT